MVTYRLFMATVGNFLKLNRAQCILSAVDSTTVYTHRGNFYNPSKPTSAAKLTAV